MQLQKSKRKIIISNGKTVAIIKKKYKKIYLYPVKSTPLFFILKKEKIIEMVRKTEPTKIGIKLIEFMFIDKKKNEIKILFDKETLALNGWETKDAYSNDVSFKINDLVINNQIVDNFLKYLKKKIFKKPFYQSFRRQKYGNVNAVLLDHHFLPTLTKDL